MKLNEADLFKLLSIATKAVKESGEYILRQKDDLSRINIKDGGSSIASKVCTETDIRSQEILLKHLKPTLDRYDLGILLEEDIDNGSRFIKDYFWSVDPLDGTLHYIESRSGFSISVALVKKSGDSVLGVVYDPVNRSLYHSVIGHGTYKNDLRLSPKKNKDHISFMIDSSFKKDPRYTTFVCDITRGIKALGYLGIDIIEGAGAVLNAIMVLDKSPGCYVKLPKKREGGGSLWDYAATSIILKEAKCFVSDIHGDKIDLNKKSSTFLNEKGILYASSGELVHIIMGVLSL